MPNLLAKLTALGLIGGGFAATGDLGWLAERGRRVLDAADVAPPSAEGGALNSDLGAAFTSGSQPAPSASESPAAVPPAPVPPAVAASTPPAIAAARPLMKPPAGGPKQIAWEGVAAGERIVVWLAAGGTRCLVLDIVDPAAGEALAYDAAAVSPEGQPLLASGPPRRVVVGRPAGASGLAVGGMISLAPAGIATVGAGGRWLGPIEALSLAD